MYRAVFTINELSTGAGDFVLTWILVPLRVDSCSFGARSRGACSLMWKEIFDGGKRSLILESGVLRFVKAGFSPKSLKRR